ncbi:MAG: Fic family protein [Thermoplasmata archaeon]|nr:Fic family protein [Thermoplasmata archaeon]
MAFEPKFTITKKIHNALLEIERARGFIDGINLRDDLIDKMRSQALILEAHHSTHIEGTELTLEQAQLILTGEQVDNVRPDDRQELLNYKEAMDFIADYLDKKTEITEGLIKNVHHILVKEVRGGILEPGQYRTVQNYVVNTATREIIYTPPDPEKVPGLMKEFVKWLNNIGDVSPVLAAGIAQHKFVDIHPFIDGNGRTARVLCTLVLYLNGYDFKRLFSLSEFYDTNRPGYYRAIQSVRQEDMDLTLWLEYFIDGLKVQMLEVKDRGEATIKKEIIIEKAKKAGLNERQEMILKYIIENKKASVDDIRQELDIVRRTVQRDFVVLVNAGLAREVATSKTDPTRYYELL